MTHPEADAYQRFAVDRVPSKLAVPEGGLPGADRAPRTERVTAAPPTDQEPGNRPSAPSGHSVPVQLLVPDGFRLRTKWCPVCRGRWSAEVVPAEQADAFKIPCPACPSSWAAVPSDEPDAERDCLENAMRGRR